MRLCKRGLIAFAALVLLLVGALLVNHVIEIVQIRDFYAGRKILSAMHQAKLEAIAAHRSSHGAAKDALLAALRTGTPKSEVTSALSGEDVVCEDVRRQPGLICYVPPSKHPITVDNWHIELRFDRDDKLADARVLILK